MKRAQHIPVFFTYCVLPICLAGVAIFRPIDIKVTTSVIETASAVVQAVAVVVALYYAKIGLYTWRHQRDHELRIGILASIHAQQSNIKSYRMWAAHNPSEVADLRNSVFSSGAELEALWVRAIYEWGDEEVQQYKLAYVQLLNRFSIQSAKFERREEQSMHESELKAAERVATLDIWDDGESDAFGREFSSLVKDITKWIRERIEIDRS